jgi:hypothetical protein
LIVGLLSGGIADVWSSWAAHLADENPRPFAAASRDSWAVLMAFGAAGCTVGFLGAVLTVHLTASWRQLRKPICAASLWASLAGTMSLLVLMGREPAVEVHDGLFFVSLFFVAGSAYGALMVLLDSGAERVVEMAARLRGLSEPEA